MSYPEKNPFRRLFFYQSWIFLRLSSESKFVCLLH